MWYHQHRPTWQGCYNYYHVFWGPWNSTLARLESYIVCMVYLSWIWNLDTNVWPIGNPAVATSCNITWHVFYVHRCGLHVHRVTFPIRWRSLRADDRPSIILSRSLLGNNGQGSLLCCAIQSFHTLPHRRLLWPTADPQLLESFQLPSFAEFAIAVLSHDA